ncbi:uncharacterized protein [Ptychodera flava]|uniref:uncharacterized protein n=1 Tax=Ptychodera flava TaxID=63121 RepID=UPI00396A4AF1
MARLYFPDDDFHFTLCKEGADIQLKILVVPLSDQHPSPPQPKHVSNVRQLIEEDLHLVITTYTPSLVYKTSLKCNCPNHRLGELLPGSEDTDDRCASVSEDRTEGICPRSAMPLTDQKLNMWYRTEVKHSVTGHQEASDQAFEEQMKTTRNVQFTPADKVCACVYITTQQ